MVNMHHDVIEQAKGRRGGKSRAKAHGECEGSARAAGPGPGFGND